MHTTKTQSRIRNVVVVTCAAGALIAQIAAAAACPTGQHGTYPHCMPDQAKPQPPYTAHSHANASGATPMRTAKPAPAKPEAAATHETGTSVGPGPVEQHPSASNTHGVIFVGGKNAINSQPVPPGHSPDTRSINSQPVPPGHSPDTRSINSQPVPPGRAAHKHPLPANPVEQKLDSGSGH